MITPSKLNDMIIRFKDGTYDKTKRDISLQVKDICFHSTEFLDFVNKLDLYVSYKADAIERAALAGIIIGIMLEKEHIL